MLKTLQFLMVTQDSMTRQTLSCSLSRRQSPRIKTRPLGHADLLRSHKQMTVT